MASANIVQLTDANFNDEVINSQVPVLVDFWAEYCYPCKMIAPAIEELAAEYQGRVKVAKLDTEKNQRMAMQYRISSIPAVMIFKGGRPLPPLIGARAKREYAAALDNVLASENQQANA